MKIKHLQIRNFRGISELDWFIDRDINCLVGAGDSTKTTILNAISFLFYPNWNLNVTDFDFFNQNIQSPIEITATVTDFPNSMMAKYSSYLRGIRGDKIIDEPELPTDVSALSIRLTIAEDLEPSWTIFTDRDNESGNCPIFSAKDRQMLSVNKLGGMYDSDFSWSKFSILSKLSDESGSIRDVIRNIRTQSIDFTEQLKNISTEIEEVAVQVGVKSNSSFVPGLDTNILQDGKGVISLHDGNVPLKMKGNGSKRLITLAILRKLAKDKSVITIDEIESGLEPYRLRHIIRQIRESINNDELAQVFTTTHSAVAVVEFKVTELVLVSRDAITGKVKILNLPNDKQIQRIVRSHDEALLAKKLIICEGDTEYGFCNGLDTYWCTNDQEFFTYFGTVPTIGSGSNKGGIDDVISNAPKMKSLGFETSILVDGDVDPGKGKDAFAELETQGIHVFRWSDGECIETIIFRDISEDGIKHLVKRAGSINSEKNVLKSILKALPSIGITILDDIDNLIITPEIRKSFGELAKTEEWFKTRDGGYILGQRVALELANIPTTELAIKINQILSWAKE